MNTKGTNFFTHEIDGFVTPWYFIDIFFLKNKLYTRIFFFFILAKFQVFNVC